MSRLMYYDEEAHQFFPMPDDQPEPMRSTTNGDRIRAMTDEELAEFILPITECGRCPTGEIPCTGDNCRKTLLDWLREEGET